MSLTTRQWVQLGASVAVAGAAIGGALLSRSPTAPKVVPGASQEAAPAIPASAPNTPPSPFDTAHEASFTVAVDTVIQWAGCIDADSTTGKLRSDLGWQACGEAPALHLAQCQVGTQTKPTFRRLLISPKGNILWLVSNPANYTMVDCTQAFHTWDSLEGVSDGRWPKP